MISREGHHDLIVVVVMPVYNAEQTVEDSVKSILSQTWTNLRLLIVNDGSTDTTPDIIHRLSSMDHRIQAIHLTENMGPGFAVNRALSSAICDEADFVARADADDINDPCRIAKQVEYLHANSEVDICGTSVTVDGRLIPMPTNPCLTRLHMLFYCSLANPSIMCRSSAVRLRYSMARSHRVCEDYRLWLDFLLVGKRFSNVPGPPLVHLKRSKSCISVKYAEEQRCSASEAARDTISALVGDPDLISSRQVEMCRQPALIHTVEQAHATYRLLARLQSTSICHCSSPCESVRDELQKRCGEIVMISMQLGDTDLFQEWLQNSPSTSAAYLQNVLQP